MSYTRSQFLDDVKQIVEGRGQNYGTPEDNFGLIGAFWNLFDKAAGAAGHDTNSPTAVGLKMALLKIARATTQPDHIDNYYDLAGYAACVGIMAIDWEDEKKRPKDTSPETASQKRKLAESNAAFAASEASLPASAMYAKPQTPQPLSTQEVIDRLNKKLSATEANDQ